MTQHQLPHDGLGSGIRDPRQLLVGTPLTEGSHERPVQWGSRWRRDQRILDGEVLPSSSRGRRSSGAPSRSLLPKRWSSRTSPTRKRLSSGRPSASDGGGASRHPSRRPRRDLQEHPRALLRNRPRRLTRNRLPWLPPSWRCAHDRPPPPSLGLSGDPWRDPQTWTRLTPCSSQLRGWSRSSSPTSWAQPSCSSE